ncbi:uncharacterized protein LOC141514222 [Macrotis lagotis]|uniref:uncharacterized protein LOC141514222 n=1 Tax=Macrotis lagotis TaxID=92651 RepID=UPI003D6909F3
MAHKWLSILGILSRLKPIDSRSIPLHWKNLTEATHFTYWTVIPGFPTVVPATWIGDPVELQLAGSAYLVLGGLKGAPPEKKHDLKSPVTLTSLHLPICLTTGSHPLCAQVINGTLKETPHGPDSNLGHGDFLHFSMIQHLMPVANLTPVDKTKGDIHYVPSLPLPNNSYIGRMALSEFNKTWHWILGGGCNTTKASWESNKTDGPCNFMDRIRVAAGMSPYQEIPHSPLPPCSPSPTMFEAVQVCSTGVPVYGPNVNGTQVYFLDGGPGPYFAAPVPHVMKDNSTRPQTHLWKAAAAFDVIIHSTDNTAPAKVNNTIWNLWAELFYDLYWVCPEGQRTDYWCNVFTTQAVTVRSSDMFLICTNTSFKWTDERYSITCNNGTMTNTLKPEYVGSNKTLIFLLQIPPVTFLPVSTSKPFADSEFLMAMMERDKRDVEFPVLDVVELVVSVLEQLEISALANQMHILAEDLQRFMQATTQAWSMQQQINREIQTELSALVSAVQALSTLVRTQMLLDGLPCHHVLKRPACMTAAVRNASEQLDRAIQTLNDHTSLPTYLDELDKIINTIRNITDQYKKDMEDNHGLFPDWINKIDLNHWMHYLLILGAWCLMALLLCCLFPLLFSLFIKMGRWALEQLKADILMLNKKGELSGVGPDRLGG